MDFFTDIDNNGFEFSKAWFGIKTTISYYRGF
jgi:hypothetical protein